MTENAKTLDRNLYVVQLTSLRGIACMVVLIGHVIQVINYRDPDYRGAADWISRAIAGTFNAEGAVLVFFVLSGCVLSLSLRNVARFDAGAIWGFYLKRVFRLYPLLWLSLALAVCSMLASASLARQGVFSAWLGGNILSAITLKHDLFSLSGLYTRYNGPMWSLRVELVCSALFPAIYLLVKTPRYRAATLMALTLLALAPVDHRFGNAFVLSFAVGALIPMLPHRPGRMDVALVLAAALALVYDRLALAALHPPERIFDVIETAASFVIVRDIFTAPQRYRWLLAPPVVGLGEISFSVYLLHLPIFLLVFVAASHAMGLQPLLDHPAAAQLLLTALTAAPTILISIFTYRWVELPMHNLGRRLAKGLQRTRGAGNTVIAVAGYQKAEPPLA